MPFDVIIPEADCDRYLADKLRLEWPGILQWMIQGCTEWQRIGLAPPRRVLAASHADFEEQDTFAHWLEECAVVDVNSKVKRSTLFSYWVDWCEKNREPTGNARTFYTLMEAHGFEQTVQAGERMFRGLRLIGGQQRPGSDGRAM